MVRKYDEVGRELIIKHLRDCKLILDLGCNTNKIREDAIGIDNGKSMTSEELKSVDYVCDLNNVERLPLCDGISISHFLEHIIDTRRFLSICYKSIREGGKIAITVPDGERANAETLGDSSNTHEMLFTPITLEIYLRHAGFKNVWAGYYERPTAYKQVKGIFARGEKWNNN